MNRHTVQHTLFCLSAALIWGFAFVFQSMASEHLGPLTFLALRNWVAFIFLCPVTALASRVTRKQEPNKRPLDKKKFILGSIVMGVILCAASGLQQAGIAYTSTAKAGFITALYVILVPLFSLVLKQAPSRKVWIGVVLGVIGLYLLSFSNGLDGLNRGDLLMIGAALMFTFHILTINFLVQYVDGILLNTAQSLVAAVIATVLMLLFEEPTFAALQAAALPVLYVGIMSSGVAYTLQIVGQKGLDPTIASLALCMESVFSALGGWLILHQTLSSRELMGCALMFAAIVIAQLPDRCVQPKNSNPL